MQRSYLLDLHMFVFRRTSGRAVGLGCQQRERSGGRKGGEFVFGLRCSSRFSGGLRGFWVWLILMLIMRVCQVGGGLRKLFRLELLTA